MKDRLQMLLSREGLTPSQFADVLGIQRSGISHMLSGRNNPGLDTIQKILIHFPHISTDWLVTGNGEMTKETVKKAVFPSLSQSKAVEPQGVLFDESNKNNAVNDFELEYTPTTPQNSQNQPINPPQEIKSVVETHFIPPVDNTSVKQQVSSSKAKETVKIVVFYSDKTFDEYAPS